MAPFKSTQSFSVGTFLKTFRNRDAVGDDALNSPVRTETAAPNVNATGGTKVPYSESPDGRTYHIFTDADVGPATFFTVTSTGGETIEVLLVAGGGGGGPGGDSAGGGGGAGGLVYRHSVPISAQAYPMVIGPGGSGKNNGGDTTGFSLTALGGGQGCGREGVPSGGPSTPGGSGGGGGSYPSYPNVSEGSGTQPGQNPGVPNLTQYGNPGYSPNDSPAPNYYPGTGGSGNAGNNRTVNATFPNSSTIISEAPPAISSKNLARGGYYSPPGAPTPWANDDYGSGGRGTPGANAGGMDGVVVVRYGIDP